MNIKGEMTVGFHKRIATACVGMAVCGVLIAGAASGQSVDTGAGQLSGLPGVYVNACYGWLKERRYVDDLTADQLTAALKQLAEKEGLHRIGRNPDQEVIEWALAWSRGTVKNFNCEIAPVKPVDVMEAVANAKREQADRDAKLKKEAKEKYWQEHANDPVTIDYAQYSQSIAGRSATPRKPAGTVRKLIVSEYLAWEKQMSEKWVRSILSAGGEASVMQVHNQCKADVVSQWINSFGYPETALRAPAFGSTVVTISFAITAACATDLVRAAGIPVTDEVSRVGSKVRF